MKDLQNEKIRLLEELVATYENQPDDSDERDYYLWDKRIRELTKQLSTLTEQINSEPKDESAEEIKDMFNAQSLEDIFNNLKSDKNGNIRGKGRAIDKIHSLHLRAMKQYHRDRIREELIKFCKAFTGIHDAEKAVDEYLKSPK